VNRARVLFGPSLGRRIGSLDALDSRGEDLPEGGSRGCTACADMVKHPGLRSAATRTPQDSRPGPFEPPYRVWGIEIALLAVGPGVRKYWSYTSSVLTGEGQAHRGVNSPVARGALSRNVILVEGW